MTTLIHDAATKRHMAILGTNGSGKTSVAKSQVVEPALAAGERICCIDPTGVMWGVRLGANGNPKGGFPIYIVGGEHADFPLTRRDGKAWAEIVGTSSDSFIFDTSLMTVADRTAWFTDFAETLIRKNKGPLRLVEDEAHLFAPQGGAKAGGLAPDMLHAANNLLALGRSKGLRITMISQRPAKLHKDSLSQAHTLVAMKLIAPQDRNAIKDWVADQTDPESGKDLIASLPTLKPGEGWVWAPADGILERVQFPLPKTYDSSRAPDEDEGEGPKLSPIDPAAVQARLAAVAAEAVANDPAKLKAEVARLTRELQKAATNIPQNIPAADPLALEAAEQRGFERGRIDGQEEGRAIGRRDGYQEATEAGVAALRGLEPPDAPAAPLPAPRPARIVPRAVERRPVASAPKASDGNGHLGAERKPLVTLASAAPGGLTEAQWATIAGFKRTGGTWSTYKSRLRGGGYIEQRGNLWYATDAGLDAVGEVPPAPSTPEERISMWKASLGSGPSKLLDELVSVYPEAMARDDLALNAGMTASGGTFSTYLSRLSGNGLIERQGGQVRAADALFA